jgi:uncharacterized protein (DUF1697 family)
LIAQDLKLTPAPMPVFVSMLRGVNVGGHNKIRMVDLRSLYLSLKLEEPQTYVQSGNVIFKAKKGDLALLQRRIKGGIEKQFGCSPEVVLRTVAELRSVVARNPFAARRDVEPNKLLVFFLAAEAAKDAKTNLREMEIAPEEMHLEKRELYIYFPNGVGKSKLPWSRIDKVLNTQGTGRNWNSITNMLAIAERMDS